MRKPTLFTLFFTFLLTLTLSVQAETNWPVGKLDTARKVSYLNDLEKNVLLELNKVRTQPAQYAEDYVKTLRPYFNGKYLEYPNEVRLITNEGVSAVDECYQVLKKAAPISSVLTPSYGMSQAVRILVKDQSKSGRTGHDTSDGKSMTDRLDMFGKWQKTVGENVDYGNNIARRVVLSLLIDDGVPSRGHRKNILNAAFNVAGLASGPHKTYRHMVAMDFAGGYVESTIPSQVMASNEPVIEGNPADVPMVFARAVHEQEFQMAWDLWTEYTKQAIVNSILQKVPDLNLTATDIRQMFDTSDPTINNFWVGFRDNFGAQQIMKETYRLLEKVSDKEALVIASPSNVQIKVFLEDGRWKLGYAESFFEQ